MRVILIAASALLAITAPPASGFAQPFPQDGEIVRNEALPRGERWEDRWRGRQHILYDGVSNASQDQAGAAAPDRTVGRAPEAEQDCGTVAVRYRRADGTTAVRREARCD